MVKQIKYSDLLGFVRANKRSFPYIYSQYKTIPNDMEYYIINKNSSILIGKDYGKIYLIFRLETNKNYRRLGYGRKLLNFLFRKKGKKLYLVTYLDESSKKFYQSLGFVEEFSSWHRMSRHK